jgi:predicted alpha/beta-hydrolase family hydrolase
MRFVFDGPEASPDVVVLAHGAGAPMDSPFLDRIASDLGRRGLRVVRFEFPYMERRRTTGRIGAPDRSVVLERRWLEVVEELGGGERLVLGGKSLGGRIASHVADRCLARGLVCLGYPFHPPGQPERLRTAHLATLATPTLILQGTRDPFGSPAEVGSYRLAPSIRVEFLPDGDHSLAPRARSSHSLDENMTLASDRIAAFVTALPGRQTTTADPPSW